MLGLARLSPPALSFVRFVLASALVTCIAMLAPAQQSPPAAESPSQLPSPPDAAAKALKEGRYGDALKFAEQVAAQNPQALEPQAAKVDALMGLRRYRDAGNLAWQLANQHPDKPELRYKAGLSAFRFGAYPASEKAWAVLSQTPGWSALGYHLGVQCFLARGQRDRGLALLKEALTLVSPPSQALMDDLLMSETDPKIVLPVLDAYLKTQVRDIEFYAAQRTLCAAAGDRLLCQADEAQTGPNPTARTQPRTGGMSSQVFVDPLSLSLIERRPIHQESEGGTFPQTNAPDLATVSPTLQQAAESQGIAGGDAGRRNASVYSSVVLPIVINDGTVQEAILDTGSSFMTVSRETARELKLQPLSIGQDAGLGGPAGAKTEWVLLQKVRIGPLTFHNVPATLIAKGSDFRAKSSVVPISLFRDWAVHYDRQSDLLKFYPSGTDPEKVMGKGTFKVPSLWFRGKPCVYTKIKEAVGLLCQLDTGAYATTVATEHAAQIDVHPNTEKYKNQTVLSATGVVSSGVAEKVRVSFGSANFNLTTVQVLPLNLDTELTPVYGNVGREILDLFEIFFDYRQNTVAFKAYK